MKQTWQITIAPAAAPITPIITPVAPVHAGFALFARWATGAARALITGSPLEPIKSRQTGFALWPYD